LIRNSQESVVSSSYKIAASILAADFTRLGDQVREAEAAGADLFHMDIMDGMFVPNISFGPMIVEAVRGITRLPLCAHLMVEKPERYVPAFAQAGANMIVVHVEASPHLHSTIQQIRSLNVRAGVAISPHTPFEMTREILSDVDHVLVLTVSPGFGGQKFIHSTLPKIEQIASAARRIDHPLEIGVDGGINPTTIGLVLEKGANVIIAGTAIFRTTGGIAAGIAALRTAAQSR
jgi:ribulose-phosphate 3-epimerase